MEIDIFSNSIESTVTFLYVFSLYTFHLIQLFFCLSVCLFVFYLLFLLFLSSFDVLDEREKSERA